MPNKTKPKPRRNPNSKQGEGKSANMIAKNGNSNRRTVQKPIGRATPKVAPPKPSAKAETVGSSHMRLNKFLASAGIASRRKADEMIQNGEVEVNGKLVTELGFKVNPEKDKVVAAGRIAKIERRKIYILLNKPKDAISTSSDELDRRTVMDFIGIDERIYTVGRLDRNTTGALLLTNDGDLAHRLMHPSFGVSKEYLAELDKKMNRADLQKLKSGMRLSDTGEKVSECEAKILGDGTSVWLKIYEGKNRQVHRMFWTLGYDVKKLDRISYAGITPKGLRRGQWRHLLPKEVDHLRKLVEQASETKT
jgi:23S rRNA pseudouridine2605 synthase/16S rRNA pseudouridine516 synthase